MRIAHLSDVHVLDLTGTPRRAFLNKRLTGLANLVGARRDAHPPALLEAAVAELTDDDGVDHVVITGDLTNLALDSEFRRAREILTPLIDRGDLSVIPGNHDIYTRGSLRTKRFERWFGDLMWPAGGDHTAQRYPWFKDLGDVKLVGLNSAYPTPWFIATGRVGPPQLARLEALADTHQLAEHFTIALVHHNLHARGRRKDAMHGLKDRDALIRSCAASGVDMILHGHSHAAHRFERDGVVIVGCGSSTWNSDHPAHAARYNVYDVLDGTLDATEVRVWDPAAGRFEPTPPDADRGAPSAEGARDSRVDTAEAVR